MRTAPRDAEHFCWRIDIVPRLTHLAGLELGAGVHLNTVAPEQAAAELRDGVIAVDAGRLLALAIAASVGGRRGGRSAATARAR